MTDIGRPTRPRALITGASRGIGYAVASALADLGWDLTICARTEEPLREATDRLRQSGSDVLPVVADLSEPDAADFLADSHLKASGRTDCLVLNAGMGLTGPWQEFPARRLSRMLQVNVETPFRLVQRLLPSLRASAAGSERGARVLAISSMAGVVSQPHSSAYGASKAALISLCETLNVEESDNGICATAISPGFVDTDMTAWVRDRVDPAQMIRASDVAELILALIRMSRWAVVPNVVMSRPGTTVWRA
jgi:NAD(P)-dependent dehydrogenase (short-subunit alcohol dehydrogenase family)